MPFFAIAGGVTPTEADRAVVAATDAATADVAKAHGATSAQVRPAWTLHKGPNVLAIPGTGNPDHLVENVAAGAVALTPDELARLDTIE